MGKIKLVRIPTVVIKRINGRVNSVTGKHSTGKVYTDVEVKQYFNMYISGYTMKEVADHFEVKFGRVGNALSKHVGVMPYWKKLSKENRYRRHGELDLMQVKEFIEQ
tara:strand:- start:4762 stop:5082 length:321 start_codon:yes stop_codon:yes gene_type:complete